MPVESEGWIAGVDLNGWGAPVVAIAQVLRVVGNNQRRLLCVLENPVSSKDYPNAVRYLRGVIENRDKGDRAIRVLVNTTLVGKPMKSVLQEGLKNYDLKFIDIVSWEPADLEGESWRVPALDLAEAALLAMEDDSLRSMEYSPNPFRVGAGKRLDESLGLKESFYDLHRMAISCGTKYPQAWSTPETSFALATTLICWAVGFSPKT
jgi:hypothetical protein